MTTTVPPPPVADRPPVNGSRMSWDFTSRRQVSSATQNYAGYSRMIVLDDGTFYAVYEADRHVYATRSTDRGHSWSAPQAIAEPDERAAANPEILQLADGRMLLATNMRPGGNNEDPELRYAIAVQFSTDGGSTFGPRKEIYTAGHTFENGCWEPAPMQLASGEIHVYFANEGPYTSSNEQEITLLRSTDNGDTWSGGEKISFRNGSRDEMPVPLLLQNGGLITSIEDNGIDGDFKPAIIRSTSTGTWKNAPVLASSPNRALAVNGEARLTAEKYAGAPYIDQAANGTTVLSFQSTQFRPHNRWEESDMIVALGQADASSFNRLSLPFPAAAPTSRFLWNSLTAIGADTIVALTSTDAYSSGGTEVWMVKGVLLNAQTAAAAGNFTVDGQLDETEYEDAGTATIGGMGMTKLTARFGYTKDHLLLGLQLNYSDAAGDAIEWQIDPYHLSLEAPDPDIYAISVKKNGEVSVRQGLGGTFVDNADLNPDVKVIVDGTTTVMEVALSWSDLGITPSRGDELGYNLVLDRAASSSGAAYCETLGNNDRSAPFTWSTIKLK